MVALLSQHTHVNILTQALAYALVICFFLVSKHISNSTRVLDDTQFLFSLFCACFSPLI